VATCASERRFAACSLLERRFALGCVFTSPRRLPAGLVSHIVHALCIVVVSTGAEPSPSL